jgi:hypothetical protein
VSFENDCCRLDLPAELLSHRSCELNSTDVVGFESAGTYNSQARLLSSVLSASVAAGTDLPLIARALTAATPALLAEARARPDDADIRRALVRWGFNAK